jgi:hypothetical protein
VLLLVPVLVSVAGCLGYDVLNLNNQQLKLFSKRLLKSVIPAHHNLNNQQLKLILCAGLSKKVKAILREFQLLVV